jgi:hypothetical protein
VVTDTFGLEADEEQGLSALLLGIGCDLLNLVTRGVSLNDLVDRRFRIVEVSLRGVRIIEPCAHLEKLTAPGVVRSLVHPGKETESDNMNDMKHPAESHGSGFASTRQNPYSTYSGDFNSFFDFGSDYQQWVEDMILRAILPDPVRGEGADVADIGAGTCQWPVAFLRRQPVMRILAVEPSRTLAYDQCVPLKADGVDLSTRLFRLCVKAQDFAAICAAPNSQYHGKFDCIYFMQSAHYIHRDEFIAVARQLAAGLKPRTGRIVIQGRNMSAQWHPWPFPDEWATQIQRSLEPLFGLADRYEAQLRTMNEVFHTVTKSTHEFTVRVSSESYWPRLAARWLPSVMSESTISDDLLRFGIDAMQQRYEKAGKKSVEWTEKFTMLSAEVI